MIANDPRDSEIETLRAQLAAMTVRAERAEHERNEFKKLYLLVTYEVERLKRQLFGKKAETVDPAQVQLAFGPVLEALERARTGGAAERTEVEAQLESLRARARAEVERRKADAKPRSRHGRRDLALEDLPVETIVLDPPERLVAGGDKLVKIGVEESEHVDYRAASLVRVRVIRNKYRLPGDAAAEQVSPIVIAPVPERPIAKGMAGPGLLAHVLVSKFADHLPLHRQESIFRRAGLRLPRSTLCGWVQGSVALLGRVVEAMWEDAKKTARWIGTDATGALVLAKDQCRRNHFWVVVAERDHVLFRFTKTHDGTVPAKLFEGFRGYLLADASAVYHELYRQEPGVTEVGCWAHSRRKLPGKPASRAHPSRHPPSSPSTPGGSFAFTAAVVLEAATRGRLVLLVIAAGSLALGIRASIAKRSRASPSRGHHTSSRASRGHCFVRCFEGA